MKRQLLHLKQVLLMCALTCTAFANAQVTTFPWTENFEDTSPTQTQWVCEHIAGTNTSVPSGLFWSIKTTTSVGYFSSTGPYEGAKMAVFDTRSHTRDGIARFISPVLNLSSTSNPTLDFFYRNLEWSGDQNELKIYYRTSSTGTWTLIKTFNTSVATWTNSGSITLPNPTATYQIALEGIADYGYGLDVDMLKVSDALLAVTEANAKDKTLNLYPNQTKDILNIKSETPISELSIFDNNGRNVLSSKESTETINVKHLNTGAYILKATDRNGKTTTQKFIKE